MQVPLNTLISLVKSNGVICLQVKMATLDCDRRKFNTLKNKSDIHVKGYGLII